MAKFNRESKITKSYKSEQATKRRSPQRKDRSEKAEIGKTEKKPSGRHFNFKEKYTEKSDTPRKKLDGPRPLKEKTFSTERSFKNRENTKTPFNKDKRTSQGNFSLTKQKAERKSPVEFYTPDFIKSKKNTRNYEKKNNENYQKQDNKVRLNKYIANAGICSRREADDLIKSGTVKVNGTIITEMGYKVNPGDKIQLGDQTLSQENKRYLLLNKPKDYLTTMDDPEGRKTVMTLIKNACKERLYPVGRLDRATTGLLLFTNDGELAKRLTHPKHQVRKVYHVSLNKNLKAIDMKKISEGLTLEDGLAEVDEISWVGEGSQKNEIGIVLHSGKNRIVRRIFEYLGYEVIKLDRTYFAGLTKKNLPRGKFRFLDEKEINILRLT